MLSRLRVGRHFADSRTTNSRFLDDLAGAASRLPMPVVTQSAVSCRAARGFRPPPRLGHGFERHAANWAEAGLRPNDLRMHRTGPQRFTGISRGYCRRVRDLIGRDVASRLGDEAVPGIWRWDPRQVDGALHARCPPVTCRAKYGEAGSASLMQINRRPVSNHRF